MWEKFINKDNMIVVVVSFIIVVGFLVESQYFATRYDVLLLKNEILQQKLEMQAYSDQRDQEVLNKLDEKYERIMQKLDALQKNNNH